MNFNRRDFLKLCAAAVGKLAVSGCSAMDAPGKGQRLDHWSIPRRSLGKTGWEISIIGLGGMVVTDIEPGQVRKLVAESVERGINYFDVAPTYGDAEIKLGPALKPYRKKIFLACKTTRRDRDGAREELDNSLDRLETDYFDLYQLHGITHVDKDVQTALAKGGAMEAILEARRAGVVRHIGFTAHSPEAALAAMREFDFQTMMYPINFVSHYTKQFDVEPIAEAKKRGMGIMCIKALAKQRWQKGTDRGTFSKCWYEPIRDKELARLALTWSLSQGVTAVLPPGHERLFRMAVELAGTGRCKSLTTDEQSRLKTLAKTLDPIF